MEPRYRLLDRPAVNTEVRRHQRDALTVSIKSSRRSRPARTPNRNPTSPASAARFGTTRTPTQHQRCSSSRSPTNRSSGDRTVKQRLYARCGIAEYWIIAGRTPQGRDRPVPVTVTGEPSVTGFGDADRLTVSGVGVVPLPPPPSSSEMVTCTELGLPPSPMTASCRVPR